MLKIVRKIHGGDLLNVYLNKEEVSIPVITEQHQEPIRLYDEDGNLVSETKPTEKLFKIVVVFKANGYHVDYLVDEKCAEDLAEELSK